METMKERIGQETNFKGRNSRFIYTNEDGTTDPIVFCSGMIVNINEKDKVAVIHAEADHGGHMHVDMIPVDYKDINGYIEGE